MTRIAVVSAGLSVPSSTRLLGDRLAASVTAQSGEPVEIHTIELRDLAHPITDNLLSGFASGDLAEAIETIRSADGLIVVSPVFSASYSGLFKSFFDILEPGLLAGVPVLIAATAGTARHSLVLEHALRPLFAHLKAIVVPTAVFAASADWGAQQGPSDPAGELQERIDRAAGELVRLLAPAGSTPQRRPAGPVFDEDSEGFTDFAALLG